MSLSTLDGTVTQAIHGLRLLDHPYYRKWQDGGLTTGDVAAYAGQYRHFERVLPEVLARTSQLLDAGSVRSLVESNLEDELSRPEPHLALFDRFAAAVGAPTEIPPSPATRQLVDLYRAGSAEGPVPALAVIAAYETQAAEIAATKADALRRYHGLEESATRFWDVHAEIEQSHSAWTLEALARLDAAADTVRQWAERSADAWWKFLDERDAICGNETSLAAI